MYAQFRKIYIDLIKYIKYICIFGWIKDTSQFNKDLMKIYNEESDEGHFLEVDVKELEKLYKFHNNLLY